jgi:hypothetical protein
MRRCNKRTQLFAKCKRVKLLSLTLSVSSFDFGLCRLRAFAAE